MTTIQLTDEEAEKFKLFCKHEQELTLEHAKWQELKTFTKNLGYGSFTLAVRDGLPYRIDNPIQTVILGIKL